MNRKLNRVLDEIQKTEGKIAEWQEHLQQLNLQKKQMEEAEIIKSIRSMKLDSREMLALLEGIQNGTVVFQSEENSGQYEDAEMESVDSTASGMAERTEMAGQTASESEESDDKEKD